MKNGVHVIMKSTTTMQSVFANLKSWNDKNIYVLKDNVNVYWPSEICPGYERGWTICILSIYVYNSFKLSWNDQKEKSLITVRK
jgi:hypothetical protein